MKDTIREELELLSKQFENFNYKIKGINIEDITINFVGALKKYNFEVKTKNNIKSIVPISYVPNENWANQKIFSNILKNEYGQEVIKPVIIVNRGEIKPSENIKRYTIPNKRKFVYLKIPYYYNGKIDFILYKMPQPTWIDIDFSLFFISRYVEDCDKFYEFLIDIVFSSGQMYFIVNNYYASAKLNSIGNAQQTYDLANERLFKIKADIVVTSKLLDEDNIKIIKIPTILNTKLSG